MNCKFYQGITEPGILSGAYWSWQAVLRGNMVYCIHDSGHGFAYKARRIITESHTIWNRGFLH